MAGAATILVADDEPALLDLATRVLRRCGYRIISAGSGEEAIQAFERSLDPIAVVVLDLCLPGIDGIEVLRRLRRSQPGLCALFASGREEDEIPEALRTDVRVNFLQKPFRGQALVAAVNRLLEGTRNDGSTLSSPEERKSPRAASSGGCP